MGICTMAAKTKASNNLEVIINTTNDQGCMDTITKK